MPIEPGVRFAGRYLIERRLGEGSAAVVWLASDEVLGRRVALKLFHDGTTSVWREAKVAALLNHPNIVLVYDVGEAEGIPYIAMEYVSGRDLRRLLDTEGALPVERGMRLFLQITRAVAAAHARGLVHRDLKPGNVIVTPTDRVKVTDFGIARMPGELISRHHGIWGTPAYLAPEIARGETPSPAGDVYSLGVLLFEMLTGRLPFDAPDPVSMMRAHLETSPPLVTELNPHIPPGLARFIRRLLAKRPDERPADAGEVVQWVERYLDASLHATRPIGVAPSPPSLPDSGARGVHPLGAAFVAILFTSLALMGFFLWQWGTTRNEVRPVPSVVPTVSVEGQVTPSFPTSTDSRSSPANLPTATPLPPDDVAPPLALEVPYLAEAAFADDGRLGEWVWEGLALIYPVEGDDAWHGLPDLSGTAWLAWNERGLMLAVRVFDDRHVQPWRSQNIVRGDAVLLWFVPSSGRPLLIGLSPGDFDRKPPEALLLEPTPGRLSEVRPVAVPLADGYVLEVRLPWLVLGDVPERGQTFDYALALSDTDLPDATMRQTLVAGTPTLRWSDPTTFERLTLR